MTSPWAGQVFCRTQQLAVPALGLQLQRPRPERTAAPRTPPGPGLATRTQGWLSAAWGRSARRKRTLGANAAPRGRTITIPAGVRLPGSPGGTMRDWSDQPEASGPFSESDLGRAQYGDPGYPAIGRIYPPQAYPAGQSPGPPDPALAAVERTRRAEAQADAAKTVPADALMVS